MCKLINNSTVYLCGKGGTNSISRGLHYDETVEKTIYCGNKLSAYNKHWHFSFVFNFILWNNHYISLVVQIWSLLYFQRPNNTCLMPAKEYLKNRPLPNSKLSPGTLSTRRCVQPHQYESAHQILMLSAVSTKEGPCECVHMRTLARVFFACIRKEWM